MEQPSTPIYDLKERSTNMNWIIYFDQLMKIIEDLEDRIAVLEGE